ncbi:SUZ domain-containing protein 1 isoform X1 [Frieseomelitta varia]|nr:SUZ domain-containing protein 1 isoform X1 [Frieseomelitta varia]
MSAVDDILESWEEIEESEVLDKKLDALQLNAVEALEEIESSSFKSSHNTGTRMIMLGEDGMRSQYVPPKPTVKILKRPTRDSQGSGDGPLVNGDKPKQPIKSLKQREQEYAEARKRILGEEKSPEEKLMQEINKIQPKSITPSSSGVPNNVIRMPTGPDGTRGFNVRR